MPHGLGGLPKAPKIMVGQNKKKTSKGPHCNYTKPVLFKGGSWKGLGGMGGKRGQGGKGTM